MSAQIFTPEEQAEMEAVARRRGFAELRAYIYTLVEQDAKAYGEAAARTPTLDELMAMPPEERTPYLEAAAALMEEEYRTNPELTATADTIDLYDYPDT